MITILKRKQRIVPATFMETKPDIKMLTHMPRPIQKRHAYRKGEYQLGIKGDQTKQPICMEVFKPLSVLLPKRRDLRKRLKVKNRILTGRL